MAPTEPRPGRRDYDDRGAMVVPMREYLEDKIRAGDQALEDRLTSSHRELQAEIRHVNAAVTEAKAQSASEHAEVQRQLVEARSEFSRGLGVLSEQIAAMRDQIHGMDVAQTRTDTALAFSFKTVAKIGAAGVVAVTLTLTIAGFVLKLTLGA